MKTIVIGDIHGCIKEFNELLEAVDYQQEDRLVLLGDLIDRGPDPAAVVRRAHELRAECVMGNHEEKALRWRRHERRHFEDPKHYKNPMRDVHLGRLAQWAKIPDEHWDWIAKWPTSVYINDSYTGVHAGCMPGVDMKHQVPNELMRLRYIRCTPTPNGYMKYRMASLKETGEPYAKSGETVLHWTELWPGPEHIVYGHYVWDEVGGHITQNEITGATTWGIDTGCVHGGYLTAKVFDRLGNSDHDSVLHSVKAHAVYAPRKPWNEE